ncbi:hypothetical protein GCM10022381_26050 [Leifsonia kafniensis]|uniref:Uncharacterized protein n=1 Tax=Leifsonia kafniensis TaxID=475957 RepID=A0ABP7KQ46_9MICO
MPPELHPQITLDVQQERGGERSRGFQVARGDVEGRISGAEPGESRRYSKATLGPGAVINLLKLEVMLPHTFDRIGRTLFPFWILSGGHCNAKVCGTQPNEHFLSQVGNRATYFREENFVEEHECTSSRDARV